VYLLLQKKAEVFVTKKRENFARCIVVGAESSRKIFIHKTSEETLNERFTGRIIKERKKATNVATAAAFKMNLSSTNLEKTLPGR
jgi:hypothetical protein